MAESEDRAKLGYARVDSVHGAPLTVNEARAIVRVYYARPAVVLDGAESCAWINLVCAARDRLRAFGIDPETLKDPP